MTSEVEESELKRVDADQEKRERVCKRHQLGVYYMRREIFGVKRFLVFAG
jgi:hypothetical protein